MDRVYLDGVELEYAVHGAGEPVLLIHAGIFADWFVPVLAEPRLTAGYQLVHYHRVGYAGSSRPTGPVSISDQAAHAYALLRHLGMDRAHVVGHSSGGNIALQLALDAPESVASLALLEPAIIDVPSGAAFFGRAVVPALRQFGTGDRVGALDTHMRAVAGADYRVVAERCLPAGALNQAAADAPTFFGTELPSVREWTFTLDDARRINQPVLAVLGSDSSTVSPIFRERQEVLVAWLSGAEPFVLPGANHLLHLQNLTGLTDAMMDFFARKSPRISLESTEVSA
jgi:3-oxoadipate enol-lactonase